MLARKEERDEEGNTRQGEDEEEQTQEGRDEVVKETLSKSPGCVLACSRGRPSFRRHGPRGCVVKAVRRADEGEWEKQTEQKVGDQ